MHIILHDNCNRWFSMFVLFYDADGWLLHVVHSANCCICIIRRCWLFSTTVDCWVLALSTLLLFLLSSSLICRLLHARCWCILSLVYCCIVVLLVDSDGCRIHQGLGSRHRRGLLLLNSQCQFKRLMQPIAIASFRRSVPSCVLFYCADSWLLCPTVHYCVYGHILW